MSVLPKNHMLPSAVESDDLSSTEVADLLDIQADEQDRRTSLTPPDGHFWKRSEHRKCCNGEKMVSDERGLPPGYYAGIRKPAQS
jgi:hypothetical protein